MVGQVTMPIPSPSEWGKINAGQPYGILSVDLGRALFSVPWGKHRAPLIYFAIEHSWGVAKTKRRGGQWPDPEPFKLNLNALANLWNVPRQRLYEARDWLVAARVFLKDDEGYWINKDAHDWSDPDTGYPLLSPSMLLYAARARARTDGPDKDPSVTPNRDTMSRPSVTSPEGPDASCHAPALHDDTVERDNVSRPSVTSHIEERGRVLDLEIKKTERERAGEPEDDLELDGPVGANTAKQVRETLWTAEQLFPLTSIRIQARTWLAAYPAAKVIAAMSYTKDRGAHTPGPYIVSCLEDPAFGLPKASSRPARASPKQETPEERHARHERLKAKLPEL